MLRLSKDDEDDGRHDKQSDIRLLSHLNITRVVSGQASPGRDPTILECSKQGGQGGQDPHASEEGNMLLNVVDYKMDVYKQRCATLPMVALMLSFV